MNDSIISIIINKGTRIFPFPTLMVVMCFSGTLKAEDDFEFDPVFLNMASPERLDITRFNKGASTLPGSYPVDIWLNNNMIGRDTLTLKDSISGYLLCVSKEMLWSLPLKHNLLKTDFYDSESHDNTCYNIKELLTEASVEFDSGLQRLDIIIPQIYIEHIPRGSVNPAQWDHGIPAGILAYSLGGYSSESYDRRANSAYANIHAGLNFQGWQLRHNGNYSWQEQGLKKYDTINTYIHRSIASLQGTITVGETNTHGQLFDSVPFSGASLVSDDRMLPESQRGYAPEIRGIARTNALVKIRQNGNLIYEVPVPPGEFIINDLYPTGYGGTLDVLVEEADGTQQSFEVPYAALAQLLRPGLSRYSLTTGKLRSTNQDDKPYFGEVTWQQGLTNYITGFIGGQLAPDYYSVLNGIAFGSEIGAISADITHSHLDKNKGEVFKGQSWRVSYSKYIPETNSNFSLATYRFSTKNYLSMTDAMSLKGSETIFNSMIRPRNRATLTLNQGLARDLGHIYISGSMQNYWGRDGHDQQYQAGYSGTYKTVTVGLSSTRSRNGYGKFENSWLLNFSIPLGRPGQNSATLRTQLTRDADGKIGEQINLSGSTGKSQQFSYGFDASHHENMGNAGTISGSYRSPWNSLSGSYGKGKGYSSASLSSNGTIIAHSGGVNFSPYTSDTFALVEAKGGEGASVSTYLGINVASNGYAIVPNLNPYQMNDITIDPRGMNDNAQLDNTRHKVAPYSGSVVKVQYNVKNGLGLLLSLQQPNGQPVPFGSEVKNLEGVIIGYVGQAGQIFGQVQSSQGTLTASWINEGVRQCQFNYQIHSENKTNSDADVVICTLDN